MSTLKAETRHGPWWRVSALFNARQCSGIWAATESNLQAVSLMITAGQAVAASRPRSEVKDDQAKHHQARGCRGGRPPAFATEAYKDRNVVQRPVNALKHNRGAATRHDKLAVRFKTTVRVANIKRWLERLS